jgi:uncharacterized protein (DUF1015 family)
MSFINILKNDFDLTKENAAVKPQKPHEFGMYISGSWYKLVAKPGTWTNDPIGVLDVTILQTKDPRQNT